MSPSLQPQPCPRIDCFQVGSEGPEICLGVRDVLGPQARFRFPPASRGRPASGRDRLFRVWDSESPAGRTMLGRARRPPWLCLLLLLLLAPPGAADPGREADESPGDWPGAQRLLEQLRKAEALSRRYLVRVSCVVWPQDCEDEDAEDAEAAAPPGDWSLPPWAQGSLDILTTWYCHFQDCCKDGRDCRISNNFPGLESDLRVRLHGQHLASEVVLRAVKDYLEMPKADKALALSFHGWSGTGKNFVAQMLAENLYRDGLNSDCVKMFVTVLHFPNPKYVDMYKEWLLSLIQETQQNCNQTLFIFDEAEKLHPGLLELLGSQLERKASEGHRAEPRRAIFLFLSNLGGNVISEVVLGLLNDGWSREEITMEHLGPHLQAEIIKSTDSGFGRSHVVKEIDFFIPFLPLEYHHVRLCARDAFLTQDLLYTEEDLDEVANMMTYVPEEGRLFSSQGCKSVSQRIAPPKVFIRH